MIWLLLLVVAAGGALGGAVNALLSDNGFLLPRAVNGTDGLIWRPGFLGNIALGAVAGAVSWGLYGPLSAMPIISNSSGSQTEALTLTLAALVGAVLVGAAGARWWTNEVDKTMLKVAASKAAGSQATPGAAEQIRFATPAGALKIANALS